MGILSLIKQDENDSEQKAFDQFLTTFFQENAAANEITMHFLLENPKRYGVKKAKNLYPEKIGRASCRERVCQYV